MPPRNGSGQYDLPAGQPVVTNTVISSTVHNALATDVATALTGSLPRNGEGPPTANIPFGNFKLTGLGSGSARTDSINVGQVQDGFSVWAGTSGGTANALTLTPSPAITAYAAGQTFRFIAAAANTGAATLAVSGLAAKSITKDGTTALSGGDIRINAVIEVVYDGTQFQITTFTALPVVVDTFSGDGVDTTFDLSVTPQSENQTSVYIFGVYQQKDTYSLAGTTITFVTAPPLGTDNIEIVSSNPAGVTNGEANTSSNVGGGVELAKAKSGVDLPFRTLIATAPITVTQNTNDATIAPTIASQAEAEAGASNVVLMTPLRTAQAIALQNVQSFIAAASDEITALSTGTAKVKFRMPYAFTVTGVRASLSTAQATDGGGGIFTVDINDSGTSILSTKITIDNTETTSTTAATPPVISDSALADDAEISVDIDQIGDGTAKGLKVALIGYRTV